MQIPYTFTAGREVEAEKFNANFDAVKAAVDTNTSDISTLDTEFNTYVNNLNIVNVKDFGAKGDGVTDDSAAIQAALTACAGGEIYLPRGSYVWKSNLTIPENTTLRGAGYGTKLVPSGAYITTNSNNRVIGIRVEGTASSVFRVFGENIRFLDNDFKSVTGGVLNQVLLLYTCDNVLILGNTFDNTGYGVLQAAGYVSDNVKIIGNTAIDMIRDFVEGNSASVNTKNWIIGFNNYKGASGYPTAATEKRFVGLTQIENVTIVNNIIEKTCGDAAIHLEDTLGKTIVTGNVFDNCVQGGSNNGYIYILNSSEDCIVAENFFRRTDTDLPAAFAVDTSSGSYSNKILLANNHIEGALVGSDYNMSGIDCRSQSNFSARGNEFYKCKYGVFHNSADDIAITGNTFDTCQYGIENQYSTSTNGGENWLVANNVFRNTVNRCLYASVNSSGTNPPKKWTITGNVFDKAVTITGNSTNKAEDIFVANNVFQGDSSLLSVSNTLRYKQSGNSFLSYSAVQPATYKTSVSAIPEFIGEIAVVSGNAYIATGTASTSDWKRID